MAPSTIRKALGAVKDQTSISLEKVAANGSRSISDLDVSIIKATRHDEFPADEKYVREILSLTCYSRAHISSCVRTLSRRLCKTRNWTVALKTLILIQRLLADGDPAYEQEIFFSTRRGTRLLNLSGFRDSSMSNPWDYSAFVRTYALYLDEQLEYRMQGRRGKGIGYGYEEENRDKRITPPAAKATPTRDMKIEQIFSKMHHLQQILERFLACKPTGGARDNRIVFVALYPIVKESFHIYSNITEIMGILVDRFIELDVPNKVKIYEAFKRLGRQLEELDVFYSWCKNAGIARLADYPEIEKITQNRLDVMDESIKEKTSFTRGKREESVKCEEETSALELPKEPKEEEDINEIKALPAPEEVEALKEEPKPKHEEKKEEIQKEVDLLNLGEDVMTNQAHGEKLALALFDGGAQPPAETTSTTSPWEACKTADWETALVESSSNLSNQKTALGGGFDTLLFNGMYQHSAMNAVMVVHGGSGSASSIALGSVGRTAMWALPVPQSEANGCATGGDPFAASAAVAPPAYVQMLEMERKQKLLMEEQLMWQQYARNGMQGQVQVVGAQNNNINTFPYNMGGYQRTNY